MASVTETTASRSSQVVTVEKEPISGLPRDFQSIADPDVVQTLQGVGEKLRELRKNTGYVLDPNELFLGLAKYKPQISWHGLPIFDNKSHPNIDGIEWGIGILIKPEGLRALFDRSSIVLLTPHVVDEIVPRVYSTKSADPKKVLEIVTEFGLGIQQRIAQLSK